MEKAIGMAQEPQESQAAATELETTFGQGLLVCAARGFSRGKGANRWMPLPRSLQTHSAVRKGALCDL